MIILPAIDIKNGKVVRLYKGQFDKVTEYSTDPLDTAKMWVDQGAQMLHIVDLDGAETGLRRNQAIVKRIANEIKVPVEVGGGIRSREVVDDLLNSGVTRVVLGTKVVEDRYSLTEYLGKWHDRIAVSLDCYNGFVAQRGWKETSSIAATDLALDLVRMGLQYLIYTDIARDGTLTGPNVDGLKEILSIGKVNVIASGGVKNIDDIKTLLSLKAANLFGVITGKAIYEGTLDIKEALEVCKKD